MTDFLRRTWAEIDLAALYNNLTAIRALLKAQTQLMGIVKADAYGHGDWRCALTMQRHGVDWFGVSNLDEALSLRAAGIVRPILILGLTPPEKAEELYQNDISQAVFCSQYARALHQKAEECGVSLRIHLKIDTGMGRLGFDGFSCDACAGEIAAVTRLPHFICEGIFTHFSCADEPGEEAQRYTRMQYEKFMGVLAALAQKGITFPLRHCCNSAATLRFPEMHLDMVRPGLILYGLHPDECCRPIVSLTPVMALKSVVSMVKALPAGRSVSYGRTFCTGKSILAATVPIGYADGYRRSLSGKGQMLLRGKKVPVIGRVCMDQLMLDVSDVPQAAAGDEVVIIGSQGDDALSAQSMAQAAGTINYELVCLIGKRVPRLYLEQGGVCGITQYLTRP